MSRVVKCVQLQGWSIFKQLQFEEYLLRHTQDNFLIFNKNMPGKSVVMGFSAKPETLLDLDAVRRDNITTIRRFTGGGTVIVDHNTVFVSFIMNANEVPSAPYPREIMAWTETVYQPAFQALLHQSSESFKLRENDYVIGEKKVAGNAQSIVKNRWIHHTSFLWQFEASNMAYLKIPAKRPAYRSDRSHLDFLRPLGPLIPSPTAFTNEVKKSISTGYEIHDISNDQAELMFAEIAQGETGFQPRTVVEEV